MSLDGPVVVTGGAGFVGSRVAARLADRTEVRVVDDLSTGSRSRVPADATFVDGDVRDRELMTELLGDAETVFHLASSVSVPRSIETPTATHRRTVDGTLQVLEAARETDTRVVAASSAAIYGDPNSVPIAETDRKRPTSPYGIDKLAVDSYVRAFHRLYGLDTVALRYFNVYGSGSEGVVGTFVEQTRAGDPITVHGDGTQTRDFVHVDDVVRATIAAASTDAVGEAFNVARGTGVSVRRLAETIREVTDIDVPITHTESRAGDVTDSVAAVQKARRELGFEAQIPLAEGIRVMCDR